MAEQYIEVDGIEYYVLVERCHDQNSSMGWILLIHAVMSNLHMWDSTVAELHNAGYCTIRVDHIGHDKTPTPVNDNDYFHMDDICRHMHAIVLDATGQKSCNAVVGCSIGGVLALRYAMLFPDDVERIVSICAPGIATTEETWRMWSKRVDIFEEDERQGTHRLCGATAKRWFSGNSVVDERARAISLKHLKTCTLPGYRILARAISNYDYSQELAGISNVKCLIVSGGRDTASSSKELRKVSETIPGGKYVLMDSAGHLPPVHGPDVFDALLLQFLNGKTL